MKRKHFTVALLFLLLLAGSLPAQDSIPTFVKDSLDTYTMRALQQWQIPGAAVCIIKNGKVVLMKGYGVKEINGTDKVDENTLFMIGSNTKAFTATALAMLETEKKLSLNDKVTKWIPSFALDNKAAGEQAIIRDFLCHRLGFQTFQGDFTYWTSNLTRKEVIEKTGHIKAVYPFRTTWGYTNYLGNPYRNYSKVYLGYSKTQNTAALKIDKALLDSVALRIPASLPLTAYTGQYFNEVYGDMNVVMENSGLQMKFAHHPNMYAKLESLGGDRFYAIFSDPIFSKAVFPFKTANGKITGVTVKVADFIEYNPYEFVKNNFPAGLQLGVQRAGGSSRTAT